MQKRKIGYVCIDMFDLKKNITFIPPNLGGSEIWWASQAEKKWVLRILGVVVSVIDNGGFEFKGRS